MSAEGPSALDAMVQDTVKGPGPPPDGLLSQKRHARGEEPFRAQIHLYREAERERLRCVGGRRRVRANSGSSRGA